MNEKKFLYCSVGFLIILFCVMLAVMLYVGDTAKIPLALGSFIIGWYGEKIYRRMKEIALNSYEKRRGETLPL